METTEQLKQQVENLQEQLKQQEKLASLGLLTAGIVHEIRNPLNFVINFGKLSSDLLKGLEEDLEDMEKDVDEETREDIRDIMASLDENLQKIKEHGERAISIIQNILLYSRGKEDERIPTDVCKLVKEYVWLSYHAMRANLKDFNISVEEQYDEGIPLQSVVPQDLSRAVLNVMNNACYAVWEKSQTGLKDYKPTVSVKVARQGNELAISITDNGTGYLEKGVTVVGKDYPTDVAVVVNVPNGIKNVYVKATSSNDIFKGMLAEMKLTEGDGMDLTSENAAGLAQFFTLPKAGKDEKDYTFTMSEMLFGLLGGFDGKHSFTLTVVDQDGNSKSDTLDITINGSAS